MGGTWQPSPHRAGAPQTPRSSSSPPPAWLRSGRTASRFRCYPELLDFGVIQSIDLIGGECFPADHQSILPSLTSRRDRSESFTAFLHPFFILRRVWRRRSGGCRWSHPSRPAPCGSATDSSLISSSQSISPIIKETTETSASSSYLDCYLYIDNGKLTTRLYDKRDDFNFPIVNFPFLSSNIPSAPAYGVYVSQLIRYARTCSNYQDFMERGKVLTQKLLSQGYQKTKLVATLKKFYGRHHDLVNPYNVAVSRIVSDVFASDAP